MEKKHIVAAAMLCLVTYAAFLFWLFRSVDDALALIIWGVSPLALLMVGIIFLGERAGRALAIVLFVLAAGGALLLLNGWLEGVDLVPLFLPFYQLALAALALATLATVRMWARLTR